MKRYGHFVLLLAMLTAFAAPARAQMDQGHLTGTVTDSQAGELTGAARARDIWADLGQASGVRMAGFDVGGSHESQQSGYESFGLRNQTRVMNDGVDTTEGTGGSGFYADFYANEEVAVSAGGGD